MGGYEEVWRQVYCVSAFRVDAERQLIGLFPLFESEGGDS